MKRLNSVGKLWHIAEAFFAVAFFVSIYVFIKTQLSEQRVLREESTAMVNLKYILSDSTKSETTLVLSVLQNTEFQGLLKINPDFVGIIEYAEDASLYVCHTDNNSYYANHRFDGTFDEAGMIFLDADCSLNPESDQLILYGHNMRNGSRFGKLKRYQDREYLLKHPIIRFATLNGDYEYKPFAVILTSVGDEFYKIFRQIQFENEEQFYAFTEYAKLCSLYEIPTDVSYGDKILTLMTCSDDVENGRLIVMCIRSS